MLDVKNAVPISPPTVPIQEIVAAEKLDLANDLAQDQQIAVIEETSLSNQLQEEKRSFAADVIERLNVDLKQFLIRSNMQDYFAQQDVMLKNLQAYELQNETVQMVDEIA